MTNFWVSPKVAFSDEDDAFKSLKKQVLHFDEVEPGIYRSGLISEEAAPFLKTLGIKTVVNFDDDAKRAKKEEESLKLFGIHTAPLPWCGWIKPPPNRIEKTLALLEDQELRPILIHCKHGQERTGVAIACWRISHDGWPADRAYQEMKAYGFRAFWYGHLKKYVYHFAKTHGDQKAKMTNPFEQAKISVLSFFYWFMKFKHPSSVF